jgi:DNA sulfur modification protein DndD
MILTKLSLTDFGVFRGQQTIPLSPRASRPIILFGGMNGAGKSTLLEAVRLCLYGPGALPTPASKEAYFNHLDSRIHSNPTLLLQPTYASVALEFQYAEPDAVHTYTVTRSWERRGAHKLIEYLEVTRDGSSLDELAAEHWQDFVRDLVPRGVSQLFFFDGEKIQHLAEDTSDQQTLASAIKSLLGLDVVQRLQTDLGIYLSRVSRPTQDGQAAREIEELQEEITRIRQTLEELRAIRQQQEGRLAELRAAIGRVEAKIASEGGAFGRNRESLLQRQATLRTQISQQEESLRQLCAGLLPFALVPKLCQQLKDQLLLEEHAAQQAAAQELLRAAKKEILQRLEAPDWWAAISEVPDGLKAKIAARLTQAIMDPLRVERREQVEMLHQLSPSVQRQLLSWIGQATGDLTKTVRESARELENLYRDLHGVEEGLRKIPPDEVLKPLLEELHALHQDLAEAGKEALLKDEEIKAAELKLTDLERRYNHAADRLAGQATQASRTQMVSRVQKVLDEYKGGLLEKKVKQLQEAVSECFTTLCRKKDALRKITIDPKDFSVTLYDKQQRALPKAQLSAGEKQIYAISMLWALARTSGRPLPMIIDTPLARLDSDHRKLLVQQYFPRASHQVLILSTDTEVDQSYFSEMRRAIAHAYRLEFDAAEHGTRITPGYFWKSADEAH